MDSGYHYERNTLRQSTTSWFGKLRHAYQVSVDFCRHFYRVNDPPDRRMLLAEERLAGGRARRWRTGSEQHELQSKSSRHIRSSTRLPTVPRRRLPGVTCQSATTSLVPFVHGTKCAGQFSGNIHAATVSHLQGSEDRLAGTSLGKPRKERCYAVAEPSGMFCWTQSATTNRYNETQRAAYSNLAAIMGRAAVHSGKIITWDQALASDFKFCPNIDELDYHRPAPVQADAQGRYPVPTPGQWTEI